MNEIEMEYFLEAIEYFSSLKSVQPNLGILAVCGGASIGLHLATICPEVSTVITFASPYCHMVPMLYHGKRLSSIADYISKLGFSKRNILFDRFGGYYFDSFLNHTPDEDIAIKIEESNAQFLIVAGADDKSMNSVPSGKYMVNRMKKHGKGNQITLLSYPGVGHFVDPPFMPQTLSQYFPASKTVAAIGGDIIETASANVHCWVQVMKFLQRNVGFSSKL